METHDLDGWGEFEETVDSLRQETKKLRDKCPSAVSDVLYRGQRDDSWPLKTTLDRQWPEMSLARYCDIMEQILQDVEPYSKQDWRGLAEEIHELKHRGLESIYLLPTSDSNAMSILAFMAYLRHHGFPSPLLDWTHCPYVAAFFAFEDVDTRVERVAIYTFREYTGFASDAIDSTHPHAMGIGPNLPETSQRHEHQCSQYSLCVKKVGSDSSLESYVFADHEKAINVPGFVMKHGVNRDVSVARNAVAKYTIPTREQTRILKVLREKGVTSCNLFGETIDTALRDLWHSILVF